MEKDKISIIVPVYNAEAALAKCIESIVSQTYRDVQLILVNDGSTDSSLDICRDYANRYSNICVVDKANGGVSSARNVGLSKAQGEYIQFVDSDDYIDRDMCKSMMESLCQTDADVCVCSMITHKGEEVSERQFEDKVIYNSDNIAKSLIKWYDSCIMNPPWNKLYKKELITHKFDENLSLGEDLIFNLEYYDKCEKAVFINKGYYHYQDINNNSLTKKYREDSFDIAVRLYKAMVDYGEKHKVSFGEMECVRKEFVSSLFYAIQYFYYYSNKKSKQKREVLESFSTDDMVLEAIDNLSSMPLQQGIVMKLLKCKQFGVIRIFFNLKKIMSKLRH